VYRDITDLLIGAWRRHMESPAAAEAGDEAIAGPELKRAVDDEVRRRGQLRRGETTPLREEVLALARDMHQQLRARPRRIVGFDPPGTDWQVARRQEAEEDERDRVELAALFGGRLKYVTAELAALGMISDSDTNLMQWQLGSRHWMGQLATDLEAIALRLPKGPQRTKSVPNPT
jgi:hypothetical protein